jgi:hypothetical protein
LEVLILKHLLVNIILTMNLPMCGKVGASIVSEEPAAENEKAAVGAAALQMQLFPKAEYAKAKDSSRKNRATLL